MDSFPIIQSLDSMAPKIILKLPMFLSKLSIENINQVLMLANSKKLMSEKG